MKMRLSPLLILAQDNNAGNGGEMFHASRKSRCRLSAPLGVLAIVAALMASAFPAAAQDAAAPETGDQNTEGKRDTGSPQADSAAEPPAPSHKGGLWERDVLTGDWGGLRTGLEDKGLAFGANYIGEVLGNPAGGIRRGAIYEGRLEMLVNIDLEKALDWKGATFHANAYQIHGRGLSANDLGNNLLTVSNIEATRATRLFDLWLEQNLFDGALSVRAGQLAADDEFFTSQYAANFINSTFGWPGILAANLPSGGPAYPLATPGVRVRVAPTEKLSLSAAVFDGDPSGPGPGNPQLRDASGTAFRTNDGAFIISEAAYALNQEKDAKGLPGTYKLGVWYHTGRFADQRADNAGRSLADPASSGIPATHRTDYGVYAIADQMVWRKPGTTDQGLGFFLRLGGSPSDRNLIDFYADGGINYKGLLPDRGDDVFGIGVAFARIGDTARGLDGDAQRFTRTLRPIRDYEAALEVTYRAQIAPWWTVQPDLQFVFHPGGNAVNPNDPSGLRPTSDAIVVGVRSAITF